MKTSEFVQLLQNELILPRDPHLADRFAALLDENYEPVAPKEPTPADGVNIVPQEPSVADPTTSNSGSILTDSQPNAGSISGEQPSNSILESEAS
jgi:hypothetical protein